LQRTNDEYTLHLLPDDLDVTLPAGTPLALAIAQAGLAVDLPCGGFGLCGKCKAQFVAHAPQPIRQEGKHLTREELEKGWRLICCHKLDTDAVINIPDNIRTRPSPILTAALERSCDLAPAVRRHVTSVPPPTTSDERSDVSRLLAALQQATGLVISPAAVPLSIARELPTTLRNSRFEVAVVTFEGGEDSTGHELLAVEPASANDTQPLLGMAFDIGTTTLVGYLIDLESGEQLAYASRLNPQIPLGDDVISRLSVATQQKDGLKSLQRSVVRGVNEIIEECTSSAGTDPSRVFEIVAAGNTTMLHLLLGVNPEPISVAPYVPVISSGISTTARSLGLRAHPQAKLTTLPCPAGYVGADTVAVVLTHLFDSTGPTALAIDIGTNGEVVLRHEGNYYCTSAAAGPAFEGGRIYQGMRAASGAISEAALCEDGDSPWLRVKTVDGAPPVGICGSGLIDVVAALLDAGVINPAGRIAEETIPSPWRNRIVFIDGQPSFQLSSAGAEAVVLTQKDVREFQMAKGSLSAVTEVLLSTAGVRWEDVSTVYLAGAFGMFINLESAQRIGLLSSIPRERIISVGNAAGAGAKLVLCSVAERRLAKKLAEGMRHVPMTLNPAYEEALIEQISFPPARAT